MTTHTHPPSRQTALHWAGLVLLSVIMSGCNQSVSPHPGRYHWSHYLTFNASQHESIIFDLRVDDDRRTIHCLASYVDYRPLASQPGATAKALGTPERTATITRGRFRFPDDGFPDMKITGRFVTPTRIEGTYQSDRASGEWTATCAEANACLTNLRKLDGAKEMAALAEGLTNGQAVSAEAVSEFVNGGLETLKCPENGEYTINPIGTEPQCSVHGNISKQIADND